MQRSIPLFFIALLSFAGCASVKAPATEHPASTSAQSRTPWWKAQLEHTGCLQIVEVKHRYDYWNEELAQNMRVAELTFDDVDTREIRRTVTSIPSTDLRKTVVGARQKTEIDYGGFVNFGGWCA